jgi:hypothetical protein
VGICLGVLNPVFSFGEWVYDPFLCTLPLGRNLYFGAAEYQKWIDKIIDFLTMIKQEYIVALPFSLTPNPQSAILGLRSVMIEVEQSLEQDYGDSKIMLLHLKLPQQLSRGG